MRDIQQPLTNTQLEILKAFSFNLNQEELQEFKNTFAAYFAKRAISGANKVWDEQNWDNKKVDKMLHTKMRKPKNNSD